MTSLVILVGLGNPGAKYAGHRHNVGFMAVDAIADRHGFTPARKKFQGELREGAIGGVKAIALKPQTFMNESGRAVGDAMRFFKATAADVVVFHDELDLAAGKIKVKVGGGVAGHNGLRSIASHIGPDFRRVRIGIGHPGDKARVTGHVLGDFAKADQEWLAPLLDAMAAAAPAIADGDAKYSSAVALERSGGARTPAAPRAVSAGAATDRREAGESPACNEDKPKNAFAEAFGKLFGRKD